MPLSVPLFSFTAWSRHGAGGADPGMGWKWSEARPEQDREVLSQATMILEKGESAALDENLALQRRLLAALRDQMFCASSEKRPSPTAPAGARAADRACPARATAAVDRRRHQRSRRRGQGLPDPRASEM